MAELADVPDLGSGAPGVQVRPLLSAPECPVNFCLQGILFYNYEIYTKNTLLFSF